MSSPFHLVFLVSGLLDGGIETVLIEYLKHFSKDKKFKITLCIAKAMGELEVYKKEIPPTVNIVYSSNTKLLTHFAQQRALRKISKLGKLFDEIILNPIRRYQTRRGIQQVITDADVVIDFDSCAYSHLKSCTAKKIAYFHFSFKQRVMQDRRRMERLGKELERYDKIVTICEAMRAEGEQLFPHLKEKLEVIYNPKFQKDVQDKAKVRPNDNRFDQPFLLAIERLEESQKDITTLLKAYSILVKTYQHTESLYIIGKGKSENELRELAKELGVEDKVIFLGFMPNPYPWIKRSKLLVHSAKFEGLPTVLIEGLMLNKLIVATDCPTGPGELLAGGKAGLLVPVGDAQALATAIHQALTDTDLQKQLLKGATERAFDFTFTAIEAKLNRIMCIEAL